MGNLNRFVQRQNVDRFREQLSAETDPGRRAVLERLLAAEIQKLEDGVGPDEADTVGHRRGNGADQDAKPR